MLSISALEHFLLMNYQFGRCFFHTLISEMSVYKYSLVTQSTLGILSLPYSSASGILLQKQFFNIVGMCFC